ncbi:MAG: hypothetical protein IJM54_00985 [Thermoguttaceae bacterium]|nr:hypothetical protein [Thermoguttaceae bacterium]
MDYLTSLKESALSVALYIWKRVCVFIWSIIGLIMPIIDGYFPEMDAEARRVLLAILFWGLHVAILVVFCKIVSWFRNAKYRKIRRDYKLAKKEAARQAKLTDPPKFSQLPVFPAMVPYADDEKEPWGAVLRGVKWEELADKCCREIRELTNRVMLMRGDNHIYSDGKNHILLVIDEVEQSKKELAIAALVMSDEGRSTSVSVRYSCWPRSIFRKNGCGFRSVNRKYRRFVRFFGAPYWEHGRQVELNGRGNHPNRPYDGIVFTPVFSDDTELRANNIATMLKVAVEHAVRSY